MLSGFLKINLLFFVLLVLGSCKKDSCDDRECEYGESINYGQFLFTFEQDSLKGLGRESFSYYPFLSGKEAYVASPVINQNVFRIALRDDSIHFYVEDSLYFRCNYEFKNSLIHSIAINDVMLCSGDCKQDSVYVLE